MVMGAVAGLAIWGLIILLMLVADDFKPPRDD